MTKITDKTQLTNCIKKVIDELNSGRDRERDIGSNAETLDGYNIVLSESIIDFP